VFLLLNFLYFSIVGTASGQFPYYPVTSPCLIPQRISSIFFIFLIAKTAYTSFSPPYYFENENKLNKYQQ